MTAYPANAEQLLASEYRGKDHFFLLFKLDKGRISLEPNSPIAVNDPALRDQIFAETGTKLPTRKEISTGTLPANLSAPVRWDSMFTASTGGTLWLKIPDQENRLYLLQNSHIKPVNPNLWNFPSGLIGDAIPRDSLSETNDETCILIPTKDGSKLIGLNYDFSGIFPDLDPEFQASVHARRALQEKNIRTQLRLKYPTHAATPIEWRTIKALPEKTGDHTPVEIDFMEKTFQFDAHILFDFKAKSINMHPSLAIDLSTLECLEALDFKHIITVDPEEFSRNHGLFTAQEARKLEAVPAAKDYIENQLPLTFVASILDHAALFAPHTPDFPEPI